MSNNAFIIIALVILGIAFISVAFFMRRNKFYRNLILAIIAMSGFSFALVPLYNVFCSVTGINGKLDLSVAAAANQEVDLSRKIVIEFVVTQNREMPWEFKAKHHSLNLHPGQLASTAYFARNTTNNTMLAQAIPSISPARASKYFKKVECFCFNRLKLGPLESASLGLTFYIDPALPADIPRITLAYTIFDVTKSYKEGLNG